MARDQDGQWAFLLPVKYLTSILHERNEHLIFRDHAYD